MTTRFRFAIAAITAAALMLANPSFAAWTNPFPVNSVNGDASSPSVGIDASGNAIIVYREAGGGLFLNTRALDGTIGSRKPITPNPAGPPFMATNAAGESAIVWQESDGANSRLHLRFRRANGSFTADTIVSQQLTDVFSIEVGIDGAGKAYVSWGANVRGVNRTFLRVKDLSTGALGPILPVSPVTGSFEQPHLAVEPGGRAYVTFISIDTLGRKRVNGRLLAKTGALSRPVKLSALGGDVADVSVALDGSGKALIAWSRVINGVRRAQARTRAADGALTPITTLSVAGNVSSVRAAIGNVGDVGTVAWRRLFAGENRLQSRRIVGGIWQPIEDISPGGMYVLDLRIGMSGNGDRSTFVFSAVEDGGANQRVRARTRRPDGTFGALDIVSLDNGLAASNPQLAVNGAGQAAASWRQQRDSAAGDLIWVGTNFLGPARQSQRR